MEDLEAVSIKEGHENLLKIQKRPLTTTGQEEEENVKKQENIRKRRKKHVVANTDIKKRVTAVEKRNVRANIK